MPNYKIAEKFKIKKSEIVRNVKNTPSNLVSGAKNTISRGKDKAAGAKKSLMKKAGVENIHVKPSADIAIRLEHCKFEQVNIEGVKILHKNLKRYCTRVQKSAHTAKPSQKEIQDLMGRVKEKLVSIKNTEQIEKSAEVKSNKSKGRGRSGAISTGKGLEKEPLPDSESELKSKETELKKQEKASKEYDKYLDNFYKKYPLVNLLETKIKKFSGIVKDYENELTSIERDISSINDKSQLINFHNRCKLASNKFFGQKRKFYVADQNSFKKITDGLIDLIIDIYYAAGDNQKKIIGSADKRLIMAIRLVANNDPLNARKELMQNVDRVLSTLSK